MTAPAIGVDRLEKRFGAVRAVRGITLHVSPGEVVGFLGPNGAGKSTTIRCLLGFIRPTSGTATVLGRPGGEVSVRRRVGYLPSELLIEPHLKGRELLSWYAALRGGVDRGRVHELSERLSLDMDVPVGSLSRGNRQKVGIVASFMHRPDVLILDEPTTGLDPLLQAELLSLVTAAREGGAAVLMSSHVLPEVDKIADRLAILRSGEIVHEATVAALHQQSQQRLELVLDRPPPDGLGSLDGVSGVDVEGTRVSLVVQGSAAALFQALSGYGVVRVTSHDDDLEDTFAQYYRERVDAPVHGDVGGGRDSSTSSADHTRAEQGVGS